MTKKFNEAFLTNKMAQSNLNIIEAIDFIAENGFNSELDSEIVDNLSSASTLIKSSLLKINQHSIINGTDEKEEVFTYRDIFSKDDNIREKAENYFDLPKKEIWKENAENPDVLVSSFGRLKNKKTLRFYTPTEHKANNGTLFYTGGLTHSTTVLRLVIETFGPSILDETRQLEMRNITFNFNDFQINNHASFYKDTTDEYNVGVDNIDWDKLFDN